MLTYPRPQKWNARPKTPSQPASGSVTDALIVSMVADGLSYEQVQQAFPEMEEEALRRIISKAVAGLGLFPGEDL